MIVSSKYLLVFTLFPLSVFGQSAWTNLQLKSYREKINENCVYSTAYCNCIYESITSTLRAKEVSYPENKPKINRILIDCQTKFRSYPNQLVEPELQISNIRFQDRKIPEEGGIRYDSEGVILIDVANKPNINRDDKTDLVQNSSDRIAYGCVVNIDNNIRGLSLEYPKYDLNNIQWGGDTTLAVKYTTDTSLVRFGIDTLTISASTWNLNSKVTAYALPTVIGFTPSEIIYRSDLQPIDDKSWTLNIKPYNQGPGDAENVKIAWSTIQGVNLTTTKSSADFAIIKSGDQTIKIPIILNQQVDQPMAQILVSISSKYTSPKTDTIEIDFKERQSSIALYTSKNMFINEIYNSKVDEIPITKKPKVYSNAIGLVIGIEEYKADDVNEVPYANHDALIVQKYFRGVLGIPENNLFVLTNNPTKQEIQTTLKEINQKKSVMAKTLESDDIDVFFYFAGHGAGNNRSEAVLVPSDVSLNDIDAALRRDEDIMNSLAKDTKGKVIGFIDACYADNSFEQGNRGIGIKPIGNISENVVIFSAVTGIQKAYPNFKEAHGSFTFELLSIFKETNGSINLADLNKRLTQQVYDASKELKQQPSVITKSLNWEEWKIID